MTENLEISGAPFALHPALTPLRDLYPENEAFQARVRARAAVKARRRRFAAHIAIIVVIYALILGSSAVTGISKVAARHYELTVTAAEDEAFKKVAAGNTELEGFDKLLEPFVYKTNQTVAVKTLSGKYLEYTSNTRSYGSYDLSNDGSKYLNHNIVDTIRAGWLGDVVNNR